MNSDDLSCFVDDLSCFGDDLCIFVLLWLCLMIVGILEIMFECS